MKRLWERVPNETRVLVALCGLAVLLAGISFVGGRASGAVVVHKTHVVKQTLAQQYGQPSQSIDGAQLNQGLAGLTCDVYQKAQAIVCHR